MRVKEPVEILEKNPEFKHWYKSNHDSYLVHVFKMVDDLNKNIWQIGYYNPNGTITSFIMEKENIKIVPEEEIFQEKKKKLNKLELENIKIDIDKALDIAADFQKNNYKGSDPQKVMLILQNIDDKIIYNITYITSNFNSLNIRVNSITGNVDSHDLSPFIKSSGKAS